MSEKEMVKHENVMKALSTVMDPELNEDLVSLKMIKSVQIKEDEVNITVELTTPNCPLKDKIQSDVEKTVAKVKGVKKVNVELTARPKEEKKDEIKLPNVKRIIAIASGKGGVGKSTVAAGLALSIAKQGYKVGLLDADFYGPNIPAILGAYDQPYVNQEKKIIPLETMGLKFISMGSIIPEGQAVIWRGPLLHNALRQFFSDVDWGELDVLLVDLPPGTGDIQLSLVHSVNVCGSVMVTTPQGLSVDDVRKAIAMFRKVYVDIIGIVENMSYFECPKCGEKSTIFSTDGGKILSEHFHIPLLAQLPLTPDIAKLSDKTEAYYKPVVDKITENW